MLVNRYQYIKFRWIFAQQRNFKCQNLLLRLLCKSQRTKSSKVCNFDRNKIPSFCKKLSYYNDIINQISFSIDSRTTYYRGMGRHTRSEITVIYCKSPLTFFTKLWFLSSWKYYYANWSKITVPPSKIVKYCNIVSLDIFLIPINFESRNLTVNLILPYTRRWNQRKNKFALLGYN